MMAEMSGQQSTNMGEKKTWTKNNMATSGHTYGTHIDNIDIPDQSLGLARL